MKSLILKDIYNIGHNAKSMLLLLLILAFWLIPMSGPVTYVIMSAVMCSMMIVTTFVFDDASKWSKYAMIMPITRKDLVRGKYLSLIVFSIVGNVIGFVLGLIGGVITHKINLFRVTDLLVLLCTMLIGLIIAVFLGSIVIPLLFKFGSAQSRVMTIGAFVIPFGIIYGINELLKALNITIGAGVTTVLAVISPVIALTIIYLMYRISCMIFVKKELQN